MNIICHAFCSVRHVEVLEVAIVNPKSGIWPNPPMNERMRCDTSINFFSPTIVEIRTLIEFAHYGSAGSDN